MATVIQLMDVEFPLRFKKPSQNMYDLTREILSKTDDIENITSSFYTTFGSPELSLLIPLHVMNRLNSRIVIPDGAQLNLTWMMESLLKMRDGPNVVVEKFRSRPIIERAAFLAAVDAYFKLYASHQTWFYLQSMNIVNEPYIFHSEQQQPLGLHPAVVFSRTFPFDQLMGDLREAGRLLHSAEGGKSLYSELNWQ